MVVDSGTVVMSVRFREQSKQNKKLYHPWWVQDCQRPEASASQNAAAQDHLPESVAGTAVFDPTPCVGLAGGHPPRYPNKAGSPRWRPLPLSSDGPCREGQASRLAPPVPSTGPAAHLMAHTGGAHASCHAPPGPIVHHTWHPGAGIIVTLPATVIQAGLYSGVRTCLGEPSLPADFILLTSVTGYPTF